jgi:hypothetical protein
MKIFLLVLSYFLAIVAEAAVFKCTDSQGNVKYLAKPCGDGEKNIEINIKTGSQVDKAGAQSRQQAEEQAKAEKALAEQEAFQKRQQLAAEAMQESAKNQLFIKQHPDRYSAYAIPPYQAEALSALVKPYRDRLAHIERLRRSAAEKALQTGQCKRVESSELNGKSTVDALVFLIDCSSGKQFYFSEKELSN